MPGNNSSQYTKGFSTLTGIMIIAAILSYIALKNSYGHAALQSQLAAAVHFYERTYDAFSCADLIKIHKLQDGSDFHAPRLNNTPCSQ